MGTLKYMNLLLHIDIHLQRVKYIINEQFMNINVFLLFCSFVFLQIMREREIEYIKLGTRRNGLKVYLSFLDGFLWRIFPLLRANRLYAIFNIGLKNLGPSYPRYFFCLLLPGVLALVRLPATNPVQRLTFLLSISADGKESPLPFLGSQPIIWLLPSSFPC